MTTDGQRSTWESVLVSQVKTAMTGRKKEIRNVGVGLFLVLRILFAG